MPARTGRPNSWWAGAPGVRAPIPERVQSEGDMSIKDFMARSERAFETAPEAPMPTSLPAPRMVAPSTSVDASSELEGRLRSKQTVRIDGRVKGEVESEKTVLVGESAKVFASIAADEVQIAGVVEGDIAARRKITLQRTAIVK